MNRAERIFQLHRMFSPLRPVKLTRILERLEVSKSTVKRDIEYMRNFMLAPIIYDTDAQAYRYDPNAEVFELPGLWFSESELFALLASGQLLESVQPRLLAQQLGPLKRRIHSLLERSGYSNREIGQKIHLQPMAHRAIDDDIFGTLASALLRGVRLRIDYAGRERGRETSRRVHPHRLMHYRDNWYLVAYCDDARAERTFAVDRVRRAWLEEAKARPASEKFLDRHINASFGIFAGPAKAWAVLRFSSARARWVADESWHPDQIGQWRAEHYELQVPYSDEREILLDVMKYGADVEVVAPQALRTALRVELGRALDQYRDER